MCSRHLVLSRHAQVKKLLTVCLEYIFSHMDLYSNSFEHLPIQIKNRILKRLTSVQVQCTNDKLIYKTLIHSQLKQIDFTSSNLDDELLQMISRCHDLRELILTRNINSTITENALLNIMPNFKKLVLLQASNCLNISDTVIQIIVENNPSLSGIDIAGCKNVTDKSLASLSTLTKLTALNISRTKITSNGLKLLAEGSSGHILKELRIADCTEVNHSAINLICEKCDALEIFIFNNCIQDNDQTIVAFENSSNLRNLKQLTWSLNW